MCNADDCEGSQSQSNAHAQNRIGKEGGVLGMLARYPGLLGLDVVLLCLDKDHSAVPGRSIAGSNSKAGLIFSRLLQSFSGALYF